MVYCYNRSAGITVSSTPVSDGEATITITTSLATPEGQYWFRVEIDGVLSFNYGDIEVIDGVTLTVEPLGSMLTSTVPVSTHFILSNTDWTASSNQSWCTVTPSSGTGNGAINVIATSHVNGRTATVTITAGSKTETFTVYQIP